MWHIATRSLGCIASFVGKVLVTLHPKKKMGVIAVLLLSQNVARDFGCHRHFGCHAHIVPFGTQGRASGYAAVAMLGVRSGLPKTSVPPLASPRIWMALLFYHSRAELTRQRAVQKWLRNIPFLPINFMSYSVFLPIHYSRVRVHIFGGIKRDYVR